MTCVCVSACTRGRVRARAWVCTNTCIILLIYFVCAQLSRIISMLTRQQRAVLLTIHQPSSTIFKSFDKVRFFAFINVLTLLFCLF